MNIGRKHFYKETTQQLTILFKWCEEHSVQFSGKETAVITSAMTEYASDTLYAFLYNPMIHESGYITVSIHRTREGAEKAMEWHKKEHIEQTIEECGKYDEEWDSCRSWKVEIIEIQE